MGRRLLQFPRERRSARQLAERGEQAEQDHPSIEVMAVVADAERIHNLAGHMDRRNTLLHKGHVWEEKHTIRSVPAASDEAARGAMLRRPLAFVDARRKGSAARPMQQNILRTV